METSCLSLFPFMPGAAAQSGCGGASRAISGRRVRGSIPSSGRPIQWLRRCRTALSAAAHSRASPHHPGRCHLTRGSRTHGQWQRPCRAACGPKEDGIAACWRGPPGSEALPAAAAYRAVRSQHSVLRGSEWCDAACACIVGFSDSWTNTDWMNACGLVDTALAFAGCADR